MATETTPAPVETKSVAPAVAEAADKVVTGMAVEDLLERWSAEETEATDAEAQVQGEAETTDEGDGSGTETESGETEPDEAGKSTDDNEHGSDNSVVEKSGGKESETAPVKATENNRKAGEPAVATELPIIPLPPELAEIETLIESADYDPFDVDTQKKIVKTLLNTVKAQQDVIESSRAVTQAAQQAQAAEKYWTDYAAKNPDVGQTARKLWEESLTKHAAKGKTGEALQAAAEAEWDIRVEQARNAAKARAAKPTEARPAPKGTTISPKSSVSARPPQPKPKTVDEKIEAGAYGDLTQIL